MAEAAQNSAVAGSGLAGDVTDENRRFLGGLGAFCVILFLLLGFSRLSDIVFPGPPIVLSLALVALVISVMNGTLFPAVGSVVGVRLILFAAWVCIVSPFGVWPGGSFAIIKEELLRSTLAFVIVAAALRTVRQCRTAMIIVGLGATIAALLAFYFDAKMVGRLVLPIGMYSNPNDFASALLLSVPFLWCFTNDRGELPMNRLVIVGGASGAILYAISLTGSRGAYLALAVVAFAVFRMARFPLRFAIVLAAIVATVSAPLWLPSSVAIRFGLETPVDDSGPRDDLAREQLMAEGSSAQRRELLRQSLVLTFRNPIMGVGAGNFPPAAADLARENDARPNWLGTHNTYTQISSEAGIPALLLYVAALIGALRLAARVRRLSLATPGQERIVRMSSALLISLISLAVTSTFGSLAYHWLFPVLAGFSVALFQAAGREMPAREIEA